MKTLGEKVVWILQQHKRVNQKYDGLPYVVHLQLVVKFAKKYIHLIPEEYRDAVIVGAWGHDAIEDTGITWNEAKRALGELEADIMFAATNEKGKVRKDRANDKYYNEIFENHLFIFVKICDRLANMYYGKTHGNQGMFETYKKELPNFKKKLYVKDFDVMWEELDNIEFTKKDEEDYPKIDKFDKDNYWWIKLPKPIPASLYKELYAKGVIPKKDLQKGTYYFGKCRNATVALWNGYEFVYMRDKMGAHFPETIFHLEDDNGFDLFVPLEITKPTDDQRVKY